MWKSVRSIHEAAALDPEKMLPPKEIWFDGEAMEKWYADREELRKELSKKSQDDLDV